MDRGEGAGRGGERPSRLIRIITVPFLDHPARDPNTNRICRNVPRDHRIRTNDAPVSNGYSRQHHYAGSDPATGADLDGLAHHPLFRDRKIGTGMIVSTGDYHRLEPDERIITDLQPTPPVEDDPPRNADIFSERNFLGVLEQDIR
jgi:hypothetical protein